MVMEFNNKMKLFVWPVFICLWLFSNSTLVMGARVAGDKGVVSVSPESGKEGKKPGHMKPPPKLPGKIPVKTGDKKIKKKKKVKDRAKKDTKKKGTDARFVTIDFDDVDIAVFVKFISELTGKNFVIDKAVKGNVTVISPTKISVKEAYKVFCSVLEVHGFTTIPAGNIIKVVPMVQARSKDIETSLLKRRSASMDKVVTQLIPLRYADPNELKKLLAPLIPRSSVMVAYPPTGMLIVTDVLSNITRLQKIIKNIDIEGIGAELTIVPLKYASATKMAKSISVLFQKRVTKSKKGFQGDPGVKVVPDERTNALILLASEDDTVKIKRLIKMLDKETPRGKGGVRVCYLENANAEDLVNVLMAIPSGEGKGTEKGRAPVLSKDVKIVADNATNALVITASRDDYLVLQDVIKKLDITRKMVYIEALLMEVSVTKTFDVGTQWKYVEQTGSHDGREMATFGQSIMGDNFMPSVINGTDSDGLTTGNVSMPAGFALGVMGEGIKIGNITFPDIGAVIRAYRTDTDIQILSTPQIMTTDNEEAEITVAKNVPYLTRTGTSDSNVDYNNYEFKDVGVTLNITPQINQQRYVRLKISQEVSQVIGNEGEGLPISLKRLVNTTVIVKDGHTVVIGGLIDQTLNASKYRVPCLGKIPVLGWFFKSVADTDDKTNLYIFITPHIIGSPAEAKKMYQNKKEEIEKIKEGVIKMYEKPESKTDKPDKT